MRLWRRHRLPAPEVNVPIGRMTVEPDAIAEDVARELRIAEPPSRLVGSSRD